MPNSYRRSPSSRHFVTSRSLAVALCLGLVACGGVGTVEVVPEKSLQQAKVSVLTEGRLSPDSERLLRLTLLDETASEDPAAAIRGLVQLARDGTGPWLGFEAHLAAAETALAEGRRLESEEGVVAAGFLLVAADLAYEVVLADLRRETPPLSGQGRFAAELYNFAAGRLVTLLHGPVSGQSAFESPLGPYRVFLEGDAKPWDNSRFELTHAAEIAVTGLENRHRSRGVGAPLVASRRVAPERLLPAGGIYPAYESFFGLTGIVRFPAPARGSEAAPRRAELVLYDPLASDDVSIGDLSIGDLSIGDLSAPLEADFTAPLAAFHEMAESRLSGAAATLRVGEHMDEVGFLMLEPYRSDKIPLLLIHGLQSRSITWIELANELRADPLLRRRYQVFAFNYPTGAPFTVSAALLRRRLEALRDRLDPEGENRLWDRSVIVGHSMGGLLTRLQVTRSGDAVWRSVSDLVFDEVQGLHEDRALLRESLFFEPVPWLSRAVFMATPHRGSRHAGGTLGRMVSSLVRVPEDLEASFRRLVESGAYPNPQGQGEDFKVPTVVESLHPDNPMFHALEGLPPQVPFHSVIGNIGLGQEVTDGVVDGRSATLAGAESELTIQSTHGVHRRPAGIAEVRRILHQHLSYLSAGVPTEEKAAASLGSGP